MINATPNQLTPFTFRPEPISIQHIQNLKRIRKRRAEEQRQRRALGRRERLGEAERQVDSDGHPDLVIAAASRQPGLHALVDFHQPRHR